MAESIPFDGMNRRFVTEMGEGDLINTMPDMFAFNNGILNYTRWQLTPEEITQIAQTGEVWIATRDGVQGMRPTWVGSARSILIQCLDRGRIWKLRPPQQPLLEDQREPA